MSRGGATQPEAAVVLDEVLANAWPAPLVQALDRWQLRFGHGLDRRTNSVWCIGTPDLALTDAVGICEGFYWRRSMPAEFRIGASTPPGLVELLVARGYSERPRHPLVAVAPLHAAPASAPVGFAFEHADAPTDRWFEVYWEAEEGRLSGDPQAAEHARTTMLAPGPEAVFVSALLDGETVAVGQGVLERGWLVLQCVATRADRRRLGGATAVLAGLAEVARARGLTRLALAVQESNSGARALYASHGFEIDHRCSYYFCPPPS